MHLSWINMGRKTTKPTLKNIHFGTAQVFNYEVTYTVLMIPLHFSNLKYKMFSRSDQADFFSELKKYLYCLYSFSWLFSLGGKKKKQLNCLLFSWRKKITFSPPHQQPRRKVSCQENKNKNKLISQWCSRHLDRQQLLLPGHCIPSGLTASAGGQELPVCSLVVPRAPASTGTASASCPTAGACSAACPHTAGGVQRGMNVIPWEISSFR